LSNIIVPFLNMFNGYTCKICKSGVDKSSNKCDGCKVELDWSRVQKPDPNKKYPTKNFCPD